MLQNGEGRRSLRDETQDKSGNRSLALPKGYMGADERIRGICVFNGLDSHIKRIVGRPTSRFLGRADEQSFPAAGFSFAEHVCPAPSGKLALTNQ